MTLAAAITQFETWTPSGFTTVTSQDTLGAGPLLAEQLPMALVRVEGIGGQGYAPYEFGGDFRWTVACNIWLIERGLGAGVADPVQSELITMFDNFAAAVELDPRLNGNLQRPMSVELVSTAPMDYAGFRYRAWQLRSVWIVKY